MLTLRVCLGLKNFLGPRDPKRIGRDEELGTGLPVRITKSLEIHGTFYVAYIEPFLRLEDGDGCLSSGVDSMIQIRGSITRKNIKARN